MSFLIGGLTPQQYHTYLNPANESKRKWKSNHCVAHFNLARYSILAVFINRLAYFILQGGAIYPNNLYLFKKFKAHQFSKLVAEEQFAKAEIIFNRFKLCPELDVNELK